MRRFRMRRRRRSFGRRMGGRRRSFSRRRFGKSRGRRRLLVAGQRF